jgi:hypothetical protein
MINTLGIIILVFLSFIIGYIIGKRVKVEYIKIPKK